MLYYQKYELKNQILQNDLVNRNIVIYVMLQKRDIIIRLPYRKLEATLITVIYININQTHKKPLRFQPLKIEHLMNILNSNTTILYITIQEENLSANCLQFLLLNKFGYNTRLFHKM